MSDCKAYREEIEELAGVGRLSLEARAHVNACAPCHALEQERASLRSLVRELEKVEAPADFEFRLRARMASSRGGGRRNPFRPVYGFAAIAAAALFLFVSASLYIRQEQQRRPEPSRSGALTAEGSGDGAKPRQREDEVTQTADANTNGVAGRTTTVSQGMRPKMRTRAAALPRDREIASRETAGQANAKKSLTFAVRSAPTLTIPLGANTQPLRVVLRDEGGQARVVPMRSVSFGSQELIAREGPGRRASSADKEGVW
jgi:hypothetical protein